MPPTAASAPARRRRPPPAHRLYPYRPGPEEAAARPARHPVVVVGAGPVGLAAALDLGLRGVPTVLLDESEGPGEGSRAICFAKRTLEIAHRLGCAAPLVEGGVVWSRGRVFRGEREVFAFDLLPEAGHRFPAFVNLPQPAFEAALVARIAAARAAGAPVEIRGGHRVTAVEPRADHVALRVETPGGPHGLEAGWLVAADGAGSPLREMLGLSFEGREFPDRFLIADIRLLDGDGPAERRFWFDPVHRAGASTLLHRQPDGIWRVDFQLGPDADRDEELKVESVRRRLDAMLGAGARYEIVWRSVYTFRCRRMERFRHGRVLFAGDAAHQVSPFGARGANSGVQDADNLSWKLALVHAGAAPETLLDSYHAERAAAADENIRHSTRSTDFIAPKSAASRAFRDAVLDLAAAHPFARPLVNSGRLSTATAYDGSPLNGPDALPGGPAGMRPGCAPLDAPVGEGFLLDRLDGGFTLLALGLGAEVPERVPESVTEGAVTARRLALDAPPGGPLAARLLGKAPSALYLLRPDGHVAARWDRFDAPALRAALRRASGQG